jgi:hypothetical protein
MQIISFRNTGLFKRGIWLTAAALISFALIPSALDGSLLQRPAPSLFAAAILGVCFVYFLWRTQFHRLADEVVDCQDHLEVQRGGTREIVPFSNISAAEAFSAGGLHRITVRLRESGRLGGRFDFLPQASLWSNPGRVSRLAVDLTDRAERSSGRKRGPLGEMD